MIDAEELLGGITHDDLLALEDWILQQEPECTGANCDAGAGWVEHDRDCSMASVGRQSGLIDRLIRCNNEVRRFTLRVRV